MRPYNDGNGYDAYEVTPSNDDDLEIFSKAIYISITGSGSLTVTTVSGREVTFTGLQANTVIPIKAKKVHATGTDVDGIVALY